MPPVRWLNVFLATGAVATVAAAWALSAPPPKPPVAAPPPAKLTPEQRVANPPPEAIDAQALDRAVRAALAFSTQFMLDRMNKNPDGWLVPPASQRKVVGYKDVEVHYKLVPVPNYKDVWGQKEVLVPVKEGTTTVWKKVMQSYLVSRERDGERMEETYDKDGPIVHTVKSEIWGPGGPDVLPHGFFAQNAMAIYVLRRCGLPGDDPSLLKLADKLVEYLDIWGMPDHTWELSWLTIGFSSLPQKRFEATRTQLAGKLLGGQLTEGPGKGMWGPICIDYPLLAKAMEHANQVEADYAKAKDQAEKFPNNKNLTDAFNKLQAYKDVLPTRFLNITRDAMRFPRIVGSIVRQDEVRKLEVEYAGMPYFIYNQTTADLHSTAQALWALRAAAEAGPLPKQTPTLESFRKTPVLPPRNTATMLENTANVLMGAQGKGFGGGWDEMNVYQATHLFDRLPNVPVPDVPPPAKWPPVASPATLVSTAEGWQALANLAQLLPPEAAASRFRTALPRAEAAAAAAAEDFLTGDPFKRSPKAAPVGGPYDYYELFMDLSGVQRRAASAEEVRRDLWSRIAYFLVLAQTQQPPTDKLIWPLFGSLPYTTQFWPGVYLSPSILARADAVNPIEYEARQQVLPANQRTPYNRANSILGAFWFPSWHVDQGVQTALLCSLLLVDGVRPPLAGVWSPDGKPATALPEDAMDLLGKTVGVRPSYQRLDLTLGDAEPSRLPVIVLEGAGKLPAVDAAVLTNLSAYLKGGGKVVAVAQQDRDAFLGDVSEQWLSKADGLTAAPLPADADVLKNLVLSDAERALVKTYVDKDGKIAAYLLPVATGKAADPAALPAPTAGQLLAAVIAAANPPHRLEPRYPITADGAGDAKTLRDKAVAELKAAALSILKQLDGK